MQKTSLLLAFSLMACLGYGQKYLQLERLHSSKTHKFQPGDEITFRLNNGQWYSRVIEDLSYENRLVLFANGHVAVDSIEAFRSFKPAKWSRPLGNQLLNFSVVWLVYSFVDQTIDSDGYNPGVILTVPTTSAGMGVLLKKLFKHRTYHIRRNKAGEVTKWRLRVLDLSVK